MCQVPRRGPRLTLIFSPVFLPQWNPQVRVPVPLCHGLHPSDALPSSLKSRPYRKSTEGQRAVPEWRQMLGVLLPGPRGRPGAPRASHCPDPSLLSHGITGECSAVWLLCSGGSASLSPRVPPPSCGWCASPGAGRLSALLPGRQAAGCGAAAALPPGLLPLCPRWARGLHPKQAHGPGFFVLSFWFPPFIYHFLFQQ